MPIQTVRLADLQTNPYRDLRIDPIDQDQVATLARSIKEFDFWGGVVARKHGDVLQIAAGHHRVHAAMKAGLVTAQIHVGTNIDDAMMARLLAQENATQRGDSSSTAATGSVAAAIRYLAPVIMRGDLAKLPGKHWDRQDGKSLQAKSPATVKDRIADDLSKLQHHIGSDNGMGWQIICDFLWGVPGFTERSTRDYLATVKSSGAYTRYIKEAAKLVGEERAEQEAKAKQREDAARKRREQAEREEKEGHERKRKADADAKRAKEASDKKRAADALKRAKEETKKAQQNKRAAKEDEERAAKERKPSRVASKADKAASSIKRVFDDEGVSPFFSNGNQKQVFRTIVEDIGLKTLALNRQAPLAKKIADLAKEQGRELSGTFIRETISAIVFAEKNAARRADNNARKEAFKRNVDMRMKEYMHHIVRDFQRIAAEGKKLTLLIRENPEVPFTISVSVLGNLKEAREFIDQIIKEHEGHGQSTVRLIASR